MKATIERVRVLDIPVDTVVMASAMDYIDELIKYNSKRNYILAMNPEKVNVLQKDTFLLQMFEHAALLLPDGIGVVLAIRWLYGKQIKRVPGADLMQNLCRESPIKGYRIFIFGAKEEVNRKAVEILRLRYPGILIVGRQNGYMSADRMEELIEEINRSEADILFVALGSPKQEKWIQQFLPKLNVKICQGIGGTLDTITGDVKRAPLLFQRLNLEWFYRLMKEPKRIRRQLVLPLFVLSILKQKLQGQEKTR